MKKILCLFGALALILTSCSSDDSSDDNGTVLLKKSITTDSEGEKLTRTYKYDGNKIVSMTNDSGEEGLYYTYTGNLITKIEFKFPDGTLEQVNTYEYDSKDRLVTFIRSEPLDELGSKEVYTYNADGTVSVKHYSGDHESQTGLNGEGTIYFSNGEVSKILISNGTSRSYTYDDKNNPMKNVLGYDKIAFEDSEASGVLHNILTETDLDYDELESSYSFTYNSDNYPTNSIENEDGETATVEFFY
ncbi:hypothetical protein GON26_12145 [Flavobacterium sp. GA093]|uniref:YD repeat-containing protein n=1 Tax=Flavobacterium hydrocarbonoxydans TaxID=2683249 RepID=A0A6I4NVS2_9FLAO|nr:hypothetical protein [Flavobacterium hydrocarbonoxydans]MWB95114.1 hypothetical protein [Flavobacterium hydrocarbonoxydans]